MLKIIALLGDAFVPILLFVEVLIPWYRGTRLLPITRTILGIFRRPALLTSSRSRLMNAETRLRAAKEDLIAAQLEAQAESLEERTNNVREGKEEESCLTTKKESP